MQRVKTKASEQKLTFVCFGCRAVFKKPASLFKRTTESASLPECTFCHNRLVFLGRYFHAPAKKDVREWRKVELLWQKGWVVDGYSYYPNLRTLVDAKNYEAESQQRKKKLHLENIRGQNEVKWNSIRIKRQNLKRHAA